MMKKIVTKILFLTVTALISASPEVLAFEHGHQPAGPSTKPVILTAEEPLLYDFNVPDIKFTNESSILPEGLTEVISRCNKLTQSQPVSLIKRTILRSNRDGLHVQYYFEMQNGLICSGTTNIDGTRFENGVFIPVTQP